MAEQANQPKQYKRRAQKSKSQKIREMIARGMTTQAICAATHVKPDFVYTIRWQMRRKEGIGSLPVKPAAHTPKAKPNKANKPTPSPLAAPAPLDHAAFPFPMSANYTVRYDDHGAPYMIVTPDAHWPVINNGGTKPSLWQKVKYFFGML